MTLHAKREQGRLSPAPHAPAFGPMPIPSFEHAGRAFPQRAIFGLCDFARVRRVVVARKHTGHHAPLYHHDQVCPFEPPSHAADQSISLGAKRRPGVHLSCVARVPHASKQSMGLMADDGNPTARSGNLTARDGNYAC